MPSPRVSRTRRTRARIGEDTKSWLGALPEHLEREGFTLVHGSPRDPLWEYLFSVPVARRNLAAFTSRHCLVGHTHVPLVFRDEDGSVEMLEPHDGFTLTLDEADQLEERARREGDERNRNRKRKHKD